MKMFIAKMALMAAAIRCITDIILRKNGLAFGLELDERNGEFIQFDRYAWKHIDDGEDIVIL